MTVQIEKLFSFMRIALAAVFFLCCQNAAVSQSADETLHQYAIDTALRLEQYYTLKETENTETAQNAEALEQAHRTIQIFEGFDNTGSLVFLDDIISYEAYALEKKNNDAFELAALFKQLSDVYNPFIDSKNGNAKAACKILERYIDSENWMIAHFSNSLMAVLKGSENDIIAAANYASAGLAVVPENQTLEAHAARYYSYSIAIYLHSSTRNTLLALDSTDGYINAALKINYPIRVSAVLSNLIYSSREIDDPATIKQLVDILIRVGEERPPQISAYIEMRAASALIRIGDYEAALAITQKGLALSNIKAISSYLKIWEIQSLAALGRSETAQREFAKFETEAASGLHGNIGDSEFHKTRALIAMDAGDARKTFTHMDRHAELSIQGILSSNNTNTATLLANLENSKMRQAEREAARKETYRFKQIALEEHVSAARRGLVLLFLLAVAAISLAGFMTYRSRTATKLKLSAEAALAGEKAKSQFLAVISHELRTPLNGIIGIAELLSRTAPSERLRKSIGIINKSGLDLLKLVEEILDMSRIEANELAICNEPSDIKEIIDGIELLWRPKIEEKDIAFTVFVSKDVPQSLNLDSMRLRQCINNLVSNSAKFTASGRIHLHVTSAPRQDARAQLSIIVADTGRGMSAEVIDNLFKPFVQADNSITRQYGGSGLGLAITRSLARLMDGDVEVVSRQEAGSEFTLTINCDVIENIARIEPPHNSDDDQTLIEDSREMNALLAGLTDSHADEAATQTAVLAAAPNPELQPDAARLQTAVLAAAQAATVQAGTVQAATAQPAPLHTAADEMVVDGLADEDLAQLFDDMPEEDAELPSPDAPSQDIPAQNLDAAIAPASDHISDDELDDIFGAFETEALEPAETAQPPAPENERDQNGSIESLSAESDLSGINILVVEDVLSNQDVIKIFLEPEGCNVICASNGYEALQAIETHDFDVILMDIRMPEMDGIEATRQIRAKAGCSSKIPIIALTADATAETNAQCMAAGANIFLTKPVIATDLFDSIRFVRQQTGQDSDQNSSQAQCHIGSEKLAS